MSVGVLNAGFDDQRQAQVTNDVRCEQVKDKQGMMYTLRAVDATWAHLANLDRAHALSMARAQEVHVHGEVGEEDLDWEGDSRLAVSPLVDDQGEVVDLQDHAEVHQWAQSARDEHGCLREEQPAANGDVVPCSVLDEFDHDSACDNAAKNSEVG